MTNFQDDLGKPVPEYLNHRLCCSKRQWTLK